MSSTILSTKKLSASQQQLLLNAGLGFVHYDAIETQCLHADLPTTYNGYIFTSQNGVRCLLNQYPNAPRSIAFCVGSKTAQLLTEQGFEVLAYTDNAEKLAEIIVKKHSKFVLVHPCGTMRRAELSNILKENNMQYYECIVYDTVLRPSRFERNFDGVLFFSPSAVKSYLQNNDIAGSIAFCIGETTAAEARKITDKIVVANKPTIENVLVQSIKALQSAKTRFKSKS